MSIDQTVAIRTGGNSLRFELVDTYEKYQHALAIRAICFMEGASLDVELALDTNDFHATHIVAYAGMEPIGALRIRWFKDFAKIERTAFRQAYRHPRYIRKMANFAFDFIARKGFDRVITHAKPRYAKLWMTLLSFEDTGKEPATYKGHEEPYIELIRHLEPPANAITLSASANMLFRPEGKWDFPSSLE